LPIESEKRDEARWLTEEWSSKLASSIEMMTERRPELTLGASLPASTLEKAADALWFSIPLDLAPDAVFFIGATQENWLRIGKTALMAAGVDEVNEADARGTYLEIVSQTTSSVAQSIALRLGKAVASQPAVEVKFSELAGLAGVIPIDISLNDPPPAKINLGWSRALEQQLSAPVIEDHAEDQVTPAKPNDSASKHPELAKSRTLDVLMEVELPVSVSFGRTELPLREVLKLNSGSIVELNRTISDPWKSS